MFGFKKKPEITVVKISAVRIKVSVKVGKKIYATYFGVSELFPAVVFKALQYDETLKAKQAPITFNPWHVLGCLPTKDATKVNSAYRKMSLVYHPDHGGTNESFNALTKAKDTALSQCS